MYFILTGVMNSETNDEIVRILFYDTNNTLLRQIDITALNTPVAIDVPQTTTKITARCRRADSTLESAILSTFHLLAYTEIPSSTYQMAEIAFNAVDVDPGVTYEKGYWNANTGAPLTSNNSRSTEFKYLLPSIVFTYVGTRYVLILFDKNKNHQINDYLITSKILVYIFDFFQNLLQN